MKSRLVVLTMLVLGMLLSTTGAGLAIDGLSGNNASIAVYGGESTPAGGGDVLGDEDTGAGQQPTDNGGTNPTDEGGSGVQPSRQVEAGADTDNLPFTGFAAIPVLLGGIALLSAGLVLRRRAGDER